MKPEVIEISSQHMNELRDRVKSDSLSPADRILLDQIMGTYSHLSLLLADKNTTISRLRQALFGSKSEKSKDILPQEAGGPSNGDLDDTSEQLDINSQVPPDLTQNETLSGGPLSPDAGAGSIDAKQANPGGGDTAQNSHTEEADSTDQRQGRGHGRNGSSVYGGATTHKVGLTDWNPGDTCPECHDGTLYEKPPGVIVRIVGQAPIQATVYRLQKLRCNLCGHTITATPPGSVAEQKYDATAASMIAMLKYGSGLPFNRLERLQGIMSIPLPASTQWDVIAELASHCTPAFQAMEKQAAQGELFFVDDTGVKILALLDKRAKQDRFREVDGAKPERTGQFTTGVVVNCQGHRIALFASDRQHAAETLGDLLKHRAKELPNPMQMCDALSRNMPTELKTILCNCLVHARRKFVEIVDQFEDECRYVIEAFKAVYQHDATAYREGMTPEQRLLFHQAQSGPVMTRLHAWLNDQMTQGSTEPNSSLGGAIKYILKHWERLTLFLRKSGAPLDNNVCERALKRAIIHRKNSLFYKTQNGARVGDMLMSLIYTCELNDVNPFDYLTEIQRHTQEVAENPDAWLPWNHHETLGIGLVSSVA